jgi:rubrerythrin
MDIFEFAMEKEKFSQDFYKDLAEKTKSKGLKNMCMMLLGEEVKHYEIIEKMRDQSIHEVMESPVLENAKEIFTKMRKSANEFNIDISELQLFEKAREFEKQSREFYLENAQKAQDIYQKMIFRQLADQEQKHYVLVDKICDFVARPKWFLENAEMVRIDDYAEGPL